jgi:ATP-dependent Clp protease adapter protein ClpS
MARAAVAAAAVREEKPVENDGEPAEPWKTVLFNCDCHTFDEVEKIVMKAAHCSLSRARQISNEVHTRGSAVVYTGVRERCEAVADVIASIGLRVKVVQ